MTISQLRNSRLGLKVVHFDLGANRLGSCFGRLRRCYSIILQDSWAEMYVASRLLSKVGELTRSRSKSRVRLRCCLAQLPVGFSSTLHHTKRSLKLVMQFDPISGGELRFLVDGAIHCFHVGIRIDYEGLSTA